VAEMEQLQEITDDLFELWVKRFGAEGKTNYIHLIGSGHILFLYQNYGYLYLYTQQGWEALMEKECFISYCYF
jgi:hypothetical protein